MLDATVRQVSIDLFLRQGTPSRDALIAVQVETSAAVLL
jgi:hypothetical protein